MREIRPGEPSAGPTHGATSRCDAPGHYNSAMTRAVFLAGLVLLAICTATSLLLVQQHLCGLSLPGCGTGSPCAQAAESVWGKLPYVAWPVSFVGLAYFLAMLVAWPTMRHGLTPLVRWLLRLGVLASLGFVIVMVQGGYVCKYCVAIHAANFVLWILVEGFARQLQRTWRPALAITTVFLAASVALGVAETLGRRAAAAMAEDQFTQSSAKILAAATQSAEEAKGTLGTLPSTAATSAPAVAAVTTTSSAPSSEPVQRGFTGRYRLGPERAVIRFVIFMDYQCKDCHLLEAALQKLFEQRADMSISVKQFPGGKECNPYTEVDHANACAAARAAEAAGLLHGNDGFWQMHFWLFDHSGRFTDAELRTALEQFCYDVDEFERVMHSDLMLGLIQADINEGFELALTSTPMVFINGVEFKGWQASGALVRVLEQIDQHKLPAKTAESDHPPAAVERYVLDWRGGRVRELPAGVQSWSRGPDSAALTIVMWGDYQQPNTALADGIIGEFMAQHPSVRYTFRHYPLSPQCNSSVQEERDPLACRAAQAAEAAGKLGGSEGYWKMHAWLLSHQPDFSDQILRAALPQMGFDPPAFFVAMEDPVVSAAISADAEAGKQAGLRNPPLICINGKIVPRWMHGEQSLLRPILDAAAKE